MPELGRWNRIDRKAHNYMMYSPYSYVVNNPINNIDYNGDFILPKEFLQRFERIAQYLANDIQGILNNKRIVNALKKHGGFTDSQLKDAFTWGQGPVIHAREFEVEKFTELGQTLAIMDGNGNVIPGSASISINIDLFEELERAEGKDRDYWLFITAVTILHEFVHYGFFENQLKTETEEEGKDFEEDAYGQVIRISNGTYKEVMDEYLNMNGQINYNNDNEPATNDNNSDSSGSNSSKKKQKKQRDADRDACKRSGGC